VEVLASAAGGINPLPSAGLKNEVSVELRGMESYVLIAIGVFAVLLYLGLMYAGVAEFVSRLTKSGKTRRRSRNRVAARRLRNGKV